MARIEFIKQLERLQATMAEMGELSRGAVALVFDTIDQDAPDPEADLHTHNAQITHCEGDVETQCMRLLLRQQPVADDLRMVSSALRAVPEFARIGELSLNLYRYLVKLDGETSRFAHGTAGELSHAARAAATGAMDAYLKRDATAAGRVVEHTKGLEKLHEQVEDQVVDAIRAGKADPHAALELSTAASYIVRIGEHASSLADIALYAAGAKPLL